MNYVDKEINGFYIEVHVDDQKPGPVRYLPMIDGDHIDATFTYDRGWWLEADSRPWDDTRVTKALREKWDRSGWLPREVWLVLEAARA